ncbi:MAG: methyltransferase family protein [Candidatus Hodarchaeota archaeon]
MSYRSDKIKNKMISITTSLSSIFIPIFQYVPVTAVWFGIMSVPVIAYIFLVFRDPSILIYDIQFLLRTPGTYIALFGFTIFIYSFIFQLTHRKQLINKGPYKIIRHPQYVAFIIMTFGMTLVAFETTPMLNSPFLDAYSMILIIWILEVLAYILLAKIEDFALKNKFGDEYVAYQNSVGFMIPRITLKKKP